MPSPKVLVVSFDGGTWSNLLPIARAGIMPNLLALIGKGTYGNLESTIPPVTPPAWSAFMTGCNPAKSGVFDFYEYQNGSYQPTFTTSKSILVDSLWKILSDNGLRVGVIDVPINYPPPAVNGFVISGWERPSKKNVFTYPESLGEKLISKLGDYPVCLTTFDKQGRKDIDFLNKLIFVTQKVGDAALWLIETEPVDFFMVHFQTTDIIQHSFWNEIMTFDFNSNNTTLRRIWEFYRTLDNYLGLIKGKLSSEGIFFLVSDHGFGPVKRRLALNVWLKENGYLKLKQDLGTQIKTKVKTTAIKVANKVDALARLKNRIKQKVQDNIEQRVIVPKGDFDLIDYKETRAFAGIGTVYGTIQLNLIGREPMGIVPEREAESLKDEIIQKLKNIKDPSLSEMFIKGIFRKEKLYEGPALRRLPDLIVIPNPTFYLFNGTIEKELFCGPSVISFGNHMSEGIIAIDSPSSTFNLDDAHICNILPTILDIFGLKQINYIDGKSMYLKETSCAVFQS